MIQQQRVFVGARCKNKLHLKKNQEVNIEDDGKYFGCCISGASAEIYGVMKIWNMKHGITGNMFAENKVETTSFLALL